MLPSVVGAVVGHRGHRSGCFQGSHAVRALAPNILCRSRSPRNPRPARATRERPFRRKFGNRIRGGTGICRPSWPILPQFGAIPGLSRPCASEVIVAHIAAPDGAPRADSFRVSPRACCRSSVVEHSLGKGEVDSSILSGSTSTPNKINSLAKRLPGREAPIRAGDQIGSSSRNYWSLVEVEADVPIPPSATSKGRRQMLRTAFAVAVAGLIFVAVSGTSQAAPIVPPPAGLTAHLNDVTEVSWRRCWRDRWGRMRCRRCWRDRWGRVRCRLI
jgi:hypothetical protein